MRSRLLCALAVALLALAGPVRSEASGLADDGRVGVVMDLQGTALLRPAGRQRWSPVSAQTVLLPGDQVRTMLRGAHAAEVRLAGGGSLVLGAGGLVRLEERGHLRLLRGDAEVSGTEKQALRVTGPGGFDTKVTAATVLRAEGNQTSTLEKAPRWLEGYRGSTTDEWMGSLVAKVDGRSVPLSVGYHKVSVVIRDQIAETTIEESFVNATSSRLEGVFSFPLPAGASISGFGMWVGNELVQADIIERQRARQIYEDILRRKKDPGLLEWSGGNLFKASVFPIEPHGEKRIRLRYTQVLPLEGSVMRYRYALRSELLRTNPLRQLQIRVAVQSSKPIVSATSATHDVQVTDTGTRHETAIEFSAEEFTPERDFEVAVKLGATSPLTVVPHRRGEDGYFMLMLAPPDLSAGEWTRDLLPEGDPLDILFVADTSGSMGPAERAEQRTFLESALALLGPEDRFRLMACDSGAVWLAGEPLAVTDENVTRALQSLDRRFSLGWSDLDKALAAAAKRASAGTLVVYLGDGIGTTGDADPVALAHRIERLTTPPGASFHAVATGSAYEQGVLEAIATHGGSTRRTDGDAAAAAYALLSEVAQPAIKELAVSFEGLRTARVYPERLPSLPAGTQQIVLGRFLPEGAGAQSGTVTVTGTLAGKPVRFAAELTIAEEESGNSFLPRLWARKHLDALLAEGRTPEIKEEIVSFSERFGIMTPYTSFLVLENDEDRERYGVARRVHMRDGERFFTDARSKVATAALREQVKKARSWRMNLRRRMLAEIADLGRGLYTSGGYGNGYAYGRGGGAGSGPSSGGKGGFYRGPAGEVGATSARWNLQAPNAPMDALGDANELEEEMPPAKSPMDESFPDSREPMDPPPPASSPAPAMEMDGDGRQMELKSSLAKKRRSRSQMRPAAEGLARFGGRAEAGLARRDQWAWIGSQIFQHFPHLPGPTPPPTAAVAPTWDDAVLELLKSVATPPDLAEGYEGGLEITSRFGPPSPDDSNWLPGGTSRTLAARENWHTRTASLGQEPQENWLAEDRGVHTVGMRLGRRRAASTNDRQAWVPYAGIERPDYTQNYATWKAAIDSQRGAQAIVRLTAPGDGDYHIVLTIDTEKHVVVRVQTVQRGTVIATRDLSGYVSVAGNWFATQTEARDGEGKLIWKREASVRELPLDEFQAAFSAALEGRDDVIFLGVENPPLAPAKQAAHDGEADFADHLAIVADLASTQLWDEAWTEWGKARALVPGKPGADWLEARLGSFSRRGEAFAKHVRRMADALAEREDPVAHALAAQIFAMISALDVNERLTLLDALARAGGDPSDAAWARWHNDYWSNQRAHQLQSAGRRAEAIQIWWRLHEERPTDPTRVQALMNALTQAGDVEGVLRLFSSVDPSGPGWHAYMVQQYFNGIGTVLWNAMRYDDLTAVSERWTKMQPAVSTAWELQLSLWIAVGRIEDCDRWVEEHLGSAAEAGEDLEARARLTAAVAIALGDTWNRRWYGSVVDEKWGQHLTRTARTLARDARADANLVSRIVGHHAFRNSAAHPELLAGLREDVSADGAMESLPASRVAQYLNWLSWRRQHVDAAVWRDVTDRALVLWRAEEDPNERRVRFGTILQLLDQHEETAEAVSFLREALAADKPEVVQSTANLLLARLLQLPWTAAIEDEALALIPRLVPENTPDLQKSQLFAGTIRWVSDSLYAARIEATLGPAAEREKLPRKELRERQRAAKATVRKGLSGRLAQEAKTTGDLLRPWFEIERMGFAAELGDDPQAVEGDAREMLLSIAAGEDDSTWVLRERSVLTLSYIAVRGKAPEGLPERVVALFGKQLEEHPKTLDWRYAIFRLLVALDRPADLETALRAWVEPTQVESRWRIALGYLMAELERLDEATAQFEEVARLDELVEAHYVSLADWYLVLGDDANREKTLERRYRSVSAQELNNRVYQEYYRLMRRGPNGVPGDMDDEILRVIRVLLGKASRPGDYVGTVRSLYQTVKDFRLLASLADGVVGHSPEAVYPFVQSAAGMIQDVHEEATCDEIRGRLEARMESARTDTDRRGFTLLMAQVERRAGEVLDQPGPHLERSLAHLKKARQGAWLPGERLLMAQYLASLGKIPHQGLADEQLAQLVLLHRGEEKGTRDRLRIAYSLHATQWGYGLADAAIDGLGAGLDEYRAACDGVLPATVNDIVETLTIWLEAQARFGAGETFLVEERARHPTSVQREWYTRRLFRLYTNCVRHGGTVSIGSGVKLYHATRELCERALADHAPDHLAEVLMLYCDLHRAAHRAAKIPGVGDDLVRFSRTLLLELLPRFGQQQARQVNQVAEALAEIESPLAGLTLLVEHLEREPAWFRRRGQDGWSAYSYRLAEWRRKIGNGLGAIEPRLLAVVLSELERDLTTMQVHRRTIYASPGNRQFWKAKATDFAEVARRIIREHAQSGIHLLHAARYQWGGLHLRREAIQTLLDADEQGVLIHDGRWALVGWLLAEKRFQEALPHAEQLVQEKPEQLQYRLANVRALHGVGRDDDGKALVDATQEHFTAFQTNAGQRWQTIRSLADLCVECAYDERAVRLFEIAIPERQRTVSGARSGQGDSELSRMYGALSQALVRLGRHDDAVDAASAAVVMWGRTNRNRDRALEALRTVLRTMPDLDAWTERYETEAATSGTDAPVIRRALAGIHLKRKEPQRALHHLRVALRHYPDDVGLHTDVIRAYKLAKDTAGIHAAIVDSLYHVPAQPDLYTRLAESLKRAGDLAGAERALTGLVEYAPSESDGHRRLAERRTSQKRHAEAVVQWRQVVRIRSLELNGWLELARAQARSGDKQGAHATLDELLRTEWGPAHRKTVEAVSKEID